MSQPRTPAQVRLRAILSGLRDGAGLTGDQLAERLGWSQSRVTRIETGKRKVSRAEAEQWADVTGADENLREELSHLAYSAATEARSWRISHSAGLAARQREMAKMERSATEILHFQPSVIPGLLQTEAYARLVIPMGDVTGQGDVDASVRERMRRQRILRERGKRRFDYVLAEGALRWRPGPKELMEEQLGKLTAAAALPSVTISVIPFDRVALTWYAYGFAVFRGVPDGDLVLAEGYATENFAADPDDVEGHEAVYGRLRESALTGPSALDFIRTILA